MADAEQLKILGRGANSWSEWRKAHPSVIVDLTSANLAGAVLRSANLEGADLEGADLEGADLAGANLAGADLEGANLLGADLAGVNLAGADLNDANLLSAVLRSANLEGADLRSAYLEGAELRSAVLEDANLEGANLAGAVLEDADLEDAVLTRANLEGADLEGAVLRGADLRGAYLEGADLRGAYLEGADLRGADLEDADLRGAYLEDADLRGAVSLSCSQLTEAVNWQSAHRDQSLECGAGILSDAASPAGPPAPESPAAEEPLSSDPPEEVKASISAGRPELIGISDLLIEQLNFNIWALKNLRLNTPEAEEAIKQLRAILAMAEELKQGLENEAPPEDTDEQIRSLLGTFVEALRRYVGSDERAVRTAVVSVALIASSLCGVTPIAQVILAASAVGDGGVLKRAQSMIKGWIRAE